MAKSKNRKKLLTMNEVILPEDSFANGVRKALIANLADMLNYQDGAIEGEDIETIHKMRVATRRMRSLIRLDDRVFNPSKIKPIKKSLKKLARMLGEVRDIDVQSLNLKEFSRSQNSQEPSPIFDYLQNRRSSAHSALLSYLESKSYRRFLEQFVRFLGPDSDGFVAVRPATVEPYQVRHVLPPMIHLFLARIRAYDTVISSENEVPFHALRIECKRLRYLLSAFESVIGSTAERFIDQLKSLQELLGEINDANVSQRYFSALVDGARFEGEMEEQIQTYIKHVTQHQQNLIKAFEPGWQMFNTRSVQKDLSDALLILR